MIPLHSRTMKSVLWILFLAYQAVPAAASPPVHKPKAHKKSITVAKPPNPAPADIHYDRDIRPILSENCFTCHGFDPNKRQASLRLDTSEGAHQKLPDGVQAISTNKNGKSELLERVMATDFRQMPPAASTKHLTKAQKELLRRWVAQGGKYEPHWSFVVPKKVAIPAVKNRTWVQNPIDNFILSKLELENITPAPPADRARLLRRVTIDLIGLSPTPSELNDFLADKTPEAYEKQVDRLLADLHFGEKMALKWLDLARYADTHGFHIDSQRDMWLWRNWVIDAYNHNMPYNQFLTEQLAGDLLPKPTLEQRIATGFNRNHPINFEGGAIPEEYQAAYVMDRVDTTATTFMGLTLRCAECHDHKYDPLSQKDYYSFYAFFNSIKEQGLDGNSGNAVPYIKVPSSTQKADAEKLQAQLAQLGVAKKDHEKQSQTKLAEWANASATQLTKPVYPADGLTASFALNETSGDHFKDTSSGIEGVIQGKAERAPGRSTRLHSGSPSGGSPPSSTYSNESALKLDGTNYVDLGKSISFEGNQSFSYGAWINPSTMEAITVVSRMDDSQDYRGWDLYISEGRIFVHIIHKWDTNALRVQSKPTIEVNKWTHVFATYDGSGKAAGVRIYINGSPVETETTHDTLNGTIVSAKPVLIGRRNPAAPFKGLISDVRIYKRALSPAEVDQLADFESIRPELLTAADKRTPAQLETLSRHFLKTNDADYGKLLAEEKSLQDKQAALDKQIPTSMVMEEQDKPRETHVLLRGQYDQPGDKVEPMTPAVLPPLPHRGRPTRLDLANWLTSKQHPLTARVAVNRFWEQFFGVGLVKTSEDFGTQGERPSHQELLDWLAVDFRDSGWDMKALIRKIVTSAAYRQSSVVTPEKLERDPENRLISRGPRFRLPAELVRDQALEFAGLLSPRIGGASFKPYQPKGLWEELSLDPEGKSFSAQTYVQDHGEEIYRRSLYVFWKRTVPPPSLQTFDAPEREFCLVRRTTTNTPLQALVLMNDPTYIEASRKLAERIMKEGGSTPEQRIRYAFRRVTCRPVKPAELKVLLQSYKYSLARYRKDAQAAKNLLLVGESKADPKCDPSELAAWSALSSILLNLDETITKS